MKETSHPELQFFNTLSARLEIETSQAREKISPQLENQRVPASAQIVSLSLYADVFEGDDFRDLTPEELSSVAFRGSSVTLRGLGGRTVTHQAPNGVHFTVSELLKAVEETERHSRGSSEWFGGVDTHHIFFEGLHLEEDGVWTVAWGS